MSLTLTILLSLISAGILAGRVYEILNLTDAATGFLLVKGVVLSPYILGLLAVIVVCCGVIIFSQFKVVEPYYSSTSKYTAFIAGIAMAAAGGFALKAEAVAPFIMAGGVALIAIAVAGLGKKKSDYIVMVLLLVFAAGLCMDVVTFNVSSYHNTVFLQNVLSYICMIAFMLTVLKNVYMPARFSRMMLYIAGMLSFAICSMMNLADVICYIITGGQSIAYLIKGIAFTLFGIYAFDNAVSAIPDKNEMKKNSIKSEKNDDVAEQPYNIEIANGTADNSATNTEMQSNVVNEKQDSYKEDENTVTAELEKLFDTIAEETADKVHDCVQQDMIDICVEEQDASTEDENSKYKMFSELFGADTQSEFSADKQRGILGETRSFKKYAEPKLNEAAPEYDMLKSMFRGEDTSQYEVAADVSAQPNKKRLLFGDKKQKAEKAVTSAYEKNTSKMETTNIDTVAALNSRQTKTETKKIVYKKPK